MITVTRMNGDKVVLNAELIESVEARPDTLITLTTGNRMMVKEEVEQVVRKIVSYRSRIEAETRRNMEETEEEEG